MNKEYEDDIKDLRFHVHTLGFFLKKLCDANPELTLPSRAAIISARNKSKKVLKEIYGYKEV